MIYSSRPRSFILGFLFIISIFCYGRAFASSTHLERLSSLVAKNPQTGLPVQSIQELVPLLPAELRSNFTFVYDSRSLFRESISPLFPRVVLFRNDARIVLSFTGDPEKPGFNILEVMSFDDKSARFEFSSVELPLARRDPTMTADRADCTRCHGKDPRPIFDSYPLWPGFYGSIQDTFPLTLQVGQKELANYLAFQSTNAKQGVYRDLIYPPKSPVSPYLDPKGFKIETIVGNLLDFPRMPNARLGMALTELNRKRIYRKLSESDIFRRREKELLAKLLNCENRADKVSESVMNDLIKENRKRLVRLGVDPDDQQQRVNDMQEIKFAASATDLVRLAEDVGVDRSDWSMALEKNSLSFFDGILSGISAGRSYYLKEDIIYEMMNHLRFDHEELRPFFRVHNVYRSFNYPFGDRPLIGRARQACQLLVAPMNVR